MNLFLLAAGLGTRFLPYTLQNPKPCIPFLNVPMGLYQFRYLAELETPISTFSVNTHHLPIHIEHLYRTQPYLKMQPIFSHEPIILGSGGALKKAEPYFNKSDPILMMNADEVYFTPNHAFLNDALEEHTRNSALATLVVTKHPEAGKKFGAIWCDGSNVKHIGKTSTDASLIPWHFIGVWILSSDIMNHLKDDTEQNIFYDILIHELDRVQIFPIQAEWFETGNSEDFLKATEHVLKNLNHYEGLKEFINTYDASEVVKNEGSLSLISKEQKIKPANLKGYNCINRTAILPAAVENSVVFSDQVIRHNS